MATRLGLRTHLRRRLQEITPDQWDDSSLDDYLNMGYHYVQEAVETVNPDAFSHYVDATDIVADQVLYPFPVNCRAPKRLRLKESNSGAYRDIDERQYRQTVPQPRPAQQVLPVQSDTVWSQDGRFIRLHPAPKTAVTEGLELTYAPILEMGADTDVPEVPLNLHYGIIIRAQLIALADTSNITDRAAVNDELEAFLKRIGEFYQKSLGQSGGSPPITVAEHIKHGPETASNFPNDFDSRD